jgi:ATP/maltotriose-dependent transcriptional regulator MalT
LLQIGLRLAGALAVFWKGRSHFSEGRELLARALGAVPAPIAASAADERAALAFRAKALAGAGVLAVFQGDRDAAHQQLAESIVLLRTLEDQHALADTIGYLGMALAFRGQWAASQAALEESEQLARAAGNAPALALALYGQARALIERGDDQQARARMEESLAVARAARARRARPGCRNTARARAGWQQPRRAPSGAQAQIRGSFLAL